MDGSPITDGEDAASRGGGGRGRWRHRDVTMESLGVSVGSGSWEGAVLQLIKVEMKGKPSREDRNEKDAAALASQARRTVTVGRSNRIGSLRVKRRKTTKAHVPSHK